jgi:hypothetical protein
MTIPPITTVMTLVILAMIATGVAFTPDVLALIEAMFITEEVLADREETTLAARYRACRNLARACGVAYSIEAWESL